MIEIIGEEGIILKLEMFFLSNEVVVVESLYSKIDWGGGIVFKIYGSKDVNLVYIK